MADLISIGIALGLGLLVGLQRQWSGDPVAGIRTFPLVAMLGVLCGILSRSYGIWIAGAGLVSCAALLVMANLLGRSNGRSDIGLTTEIALLVMFGAGLALPAGFRLESVVCAGVTMVLLQIKTPLHGAVKRFDETELKEIARLALAGMVILPLLPDRDMGVFGVFNPFEVWLLVVLIIGVSLLAYLAGKFSGGSKGIWLTGILGGMVSSTATTVSAARRAKAGGGNPAAYAIVALVASCVVYARVLVEIIISAPQEWLKMTGPFFVMLAWSGAIAWLVHRCLGGKTTPELPDEAPPSEMKAAVVFALLYIGVLYGVAFAKQKFGESALYAVAAISGLTDMDAITLSSSRMVAAKQIPPETGWRLVMIGGMANLVLKGGIVATLGHRKMSLPTLAGFAAAIAAGGVMLVFWP